MVDTEQAKVEAHKIAYGHITLMYPPQRRESREAEDCYLRQFYHEFRSMVFRDYR